MGMRNLVRSLSFLSATALLVFTGACTTTTAEEEGDDAFSSNQATLMTFTFESEVNIGEDSWMSDEDAIQDHLLYTIGHLNQQKSVGRLDAVKLSKIVRRKQGDNQIVSYRAELPVAWGSKTNLPTSYKFILPKSLSSEGREKFAESYKKTCVDFGAHDVDSGSMWYYYRPEKKGCALAEGDVVRATATAVKSSLNTTGKYPEYNKVYEDNEVNIVAVFGKYENGKTTAADSGISAYNQFVSAAIAKLKPLKLETLPAKVPSAPGVALPDVELRGELADGAKIRINALLVDEVSSASPAFFARYEALSTNADLIAYNGHAGLGQNVRALSAHGKFKKGQYAIVFMNGCDTFAYVDGSLAEKRRQLNPDDPTGTRYMEFVTNAMPAFFSAMPTASFALISGLMDRKNPKTYDQLFETVSKNQMIVVTGEEDNQFKP